MLLGAIKELAAQNEALKQQAAAANTRAATAETKAAAAKEQAAAATATFDTFEARLRRLEAGNAQAQR